MTWKERKKNHFLPGKHSQELAEVDCTVSVTVDFIDL